MSPRAFFSHPKTKLILRDSWAISWPMTLIMLFIFVIGLVDVFVAGKFGKEVQAAYGLAFQFYFVLGICVSSLSVGTVSLVSRLFTANKGDDFKKAIDSALIVAFITGCVLSIIGIFSAAFLVERLHIPSVIKYISVPLIQLYSGGLLFYAFLLNTNAVLRACGMVRKSLVTMAIVCVVNVIIIFPLAFKTTLHFRGIAIATVISMFVGCACNTFFMRKLISLRPRFSWPTIKKIVHVSWPNGVLQLLWQLGVMALFLILGALPKFRVEIMAAFTNGTKIESAIFLPAFAFSMANAVVTGNLLGKQEKDDAFRSGIVTALIGVVIVAVLTVLVMFNARMISSVLSDNNVVVRECMRYIYISLIMEPLMAWGVILSGSLNGAGDTKSVMAIVILSIWLARIPCAYVCAITFGFGAAAVWWSMNLSILIQTIFISRHYFRKQWLLHPERAITIE